MICACSEGKNGRKKRKETKWCAVSPFTTHAVGYGESMMKRLHSNALCG